MAGRWEQVRERVLAAPEARERYERTRRTVTGTREVLHRIEEERERAGLTKRELADRLGTDPASVRRLLTAQSANPTLKTLLEMLDVLGLELALCPRGGPANGAAETRPPTADRVRG